MEKQSDFNDYYYFLKEEINKFRGPVKEYVYYLPALFRILTGLLNEGSLDTIDKNRILCALGYLIAPTDVVPESVYGPAGYVDDIFVCCCVLSNCISKYGIDLVSPFWEMETDPVDAFVKSVLEETRDELGDKVGEIMDYTGLGEILTG